MGLMGPMAASSERNPAGRRGPSPRDRWAAAGAIDRLAIETSDLPALMRAAVQLVARALPLDSIGIFELSPGGEELRRVAGAGEGFGDAAPLTMTASELPRTFQGLRSGQPLLVRGRRRGRLLGRLRPGGQADLMKAVSVTIPGRDRPYGALVALGRPWSEVREADVDFLQGVANVLSMAVARGQAEQLLKSSEERFRRLAENAPDLIFRVRLHPRPAFEYVSPSLTALTGHRPDDLYRDARAALALVHRDDVDRFWSAISHPEAAEDPTAFRLVRRDGGLLWAEQRLIAIRDPDGTLVAVEGAIRDVTAHHRVEELLRALNDVARAIIEGREPADTLRLIARHARLLVDADQSAVAVEGPGLDSMVVAVADGFGADELQAASFPKASSLLGQVVGSGRSLVVDDLGARSAQWRGGAGPAIVVALAAQAGTLGALVVANLREGRRLGEGELKVVETFAQQAAIALEQGRGREALERLAVLEDRGRIARELHDGVIQALFGIGMTLQATVASADKPDVVRRRLTDEIAAIDRVIADVRNYIFELRPAILADQRLEQALTLLAHTFEDRYRVPVALEVDRRAARQLEGVAAEVVQITREALSNVGRHSGASRCRLTLERRGGDIVLGVSDDGRGFPADRDLASGRGLENMRNRARTLGADFRVESRAGGGSAIQVRFPVTSRSAGRPRPP
jgi:PAS domain S-box-containing protein